METFNNCFIYLYFFLYNLHYLPTYTATHVRNIYFTISWVTTYFSHILLGLYEGDNFNYFYQTAMSSVLESVPCFFLLFLTSSY